MKSGIFSRAGNPFIEMEACYTNFIKKAAKKCRMNGKKDTYISLFKVNGARILDEPITLKGKAKRWTLGNYLLLLKKAPSNVKLGIGYLPISKVHELLSWGGGDFILRLS